jgi:hypothetical protein
MQLDMCSFLSDASFANEVDLSLWPLMTKSHWFYYNFLGEIF